MSRKKLTYSYVKKVFEKNGYILISKDYKGAQIKIVIGIRLGIEQLCIGDTE